MYEYIKGIIEDIGADYIVLEAGGIGYFITATGGTINMCRVGESVKIYIYQSVKEDNISLYGFASAEEKRMFLRLVSVSGIADTLCLIPGLCVFFITILSFQFNQNCTEQLCFTNSLPTDRQKINTHRS